MITDVNSFCGCVECSGVSGNFNKIKNTDNARLMVRYIDGFGNDTSISLDVQGNTIDDLFSAFGQAAKGLGFMESSIHLYVPEC